jgi:hypothetical protein
VIAVCGKGLDVRAWMPNVDRVPSIVLNNFVNVPHVDAPSTSVGDLVTVGNLEAVKTIATCCASSRPLDMQGTSTRSTCSARVLSDHAC